MGVRVDVTVGVRVEVAVGVCVGVLDAVAVGAIVALAGGALVGLMSATWGDGAGGLPVAEHAASVKTANTAATIPIARPKRLIRVVMDDLADCPARPGSVRG